MPVLAALLAACSPPNQRGALAGTIASAVAEAGDGGVVDMGSVINLDWDTMYAFGGYTTYDDVSAVIGTHWGSGDDSEVPYDGRELVIFMRAGTVVAWTALNAGPLPGDTAVRINHPSEAIPIEKARFRVDLDGQTTSGNDLFRLDLTEASPP